MLSELSLLREDTVWRTPNLVSMYREWHKHTPTSPRDREQKDVDRGSIRTSTGELFLYINKRGQAMFTCEVNLRYALKCTIMWFINVCYFTILRIFDRWSFRFQDNGKLSYAHGWCHIRQGHWLCFFSSIPAMSIWKATICPCLFSPWPENRKKM